MPSSFGLNKKHQMFKGGVVRSHVRINGEADKIIRDKISPSGVQPLADHPFFENPSVSNIVPSQPVLSTFSKAPLNSNAMIKGPGAVGSGFFNINFSNTKKAGRNKKVYLDLK